MCVSNSGRDVIGRADTGYVAGISETCCRDYQRLWVVLVLLKEIDQL